MKIPFRTLSENVIVVQYIGLVAVTLAMLFGFQAAFGGKPAPIGSRYIHQGQVGRQAVFAGKSDRHTAAPTEEQRQSSPHRAASHHSSGRALARLQLLILIHPPPRKAERRCLSGDGRAAPFDAVELIACRSKRSRPEGNAPG